MGKMTCKCGKILSNVDCPSDVDLWAFENKTLQSLAKTNIILTDAVMDYHIPGSYYWYCKDCGRVYVFRNNHQMYNRVYLIHKYNNEDTVDNILNMQELHFYTDKQIEEPTEKNFDYTLREFLENPPHPYRYFITSDQSRVYAFDSKKQCIAHYYQLEQTYDDEPETDTSTN